MVGTRPSGSGKRWWAPSVGARRRGVARYSISTARHGTAWRSTAEQGHGPWRITSRSRSTPHVTAQPTHQAKVLQRRVGGDAGAQQRRRPVQRQALGHPHGKAAHAGRGGRVDAQAQHPWRDWAAAGYLPATAARAHATTDGSTRCGSALPALCMRRPPRRTCSSPQHGLSSRPG